VRGDLYLLGLTLYFMLTGKHAIDAAELKHKSRILRRVRAGVELELPGVRAGLARLVKRLCSLKAEERPSTVKDVLEVLFREQFAFFKDVDSAALQSELVKLGVDPNKLDSETGQDPGSETELQRLKREAATAKEELEAVTRESAAMKEELESLLLEVGERLLPEDPAGAKALLKRCRLPRARELLVLNWFAGHFAESFADVIKAWLPWVQHATLLKEVDFTFDPGERPYVRDKRMKEVVVPDLERTLKGHERTLLIGQSPNGNALFGAFLKPAWLSRAGVRGETTAIFKSTFGSEPDFSRSESFVFTLKNIRRTEPAKFKLGGWIETLCELVPMNERDVVEDRTGPTGVVLMMGLAIVPAPIKVWTEEYLSRIYEGGSRANATLWTGDGETSGVRRLEVWQLA
jgi:hypothetical protein